MHFLITRYQKSAEQFSKDHKVYWSHLSRLNGLLVILNVSLFFLTELVTTQSYYFTFFSLLSLGFVYLGLLIPIGCINRLWYYLIFLFLEIIGGYFLVASGWYWVSTNRI
jgi:hypothetical protein